MVSFTGGVPTGQAVMAAASDRLRPLVLKLGGNDAAIVAPDQPIDDALAARIFDAAFVTSGQVCMAIKRLLVPEGKSAASSRRSSPGCPTRWSATASPPT